MTDGYDEIRRTLRERGYLGGRVERFVLGGGNGAKPMRAASAALRAAVVGGPILGLLFAGTVVAVNRPILAFADVPVLWLYFSILGAAGLFLVALATGVATAAFARRRGPKPGDPVRASILLGTVTLGYFAVLHANRPVGGDWRQDAWMLLGALAATFVAAWLGGLVSLAGIIGKTGQVPDRVRRPLLWLAAALVPLAAVLAAIDVASASRRPAAAVAAAPFTRSPDGEALLFVGIDGLDGALVERFEPRGALPALLRRFESGAVFPLRRSPGREPAEVWTSLVTGVGVEKHGVAGAGVERLPGVATPLRSEAGPAPLRTLLRVALPTRTIPTSLAHRRVRSLWEIAALDVGAAAVGWWASWPAPPAPPGGPAAYVVSDRTLPKLLAGAAGDRDTAPESLFERLRSDFAADREALRVEFDARFGRSSTPEVARIVWESFLIDGWNARVAERILRDDSVRAAFVYLPGLDILRVRLARADLSKRLAAGEAEELVAAYLRWLDGVVDALAQRPPDWSLLLVADPGRSAAAAAEGFVHLSGPAIERGCIGRPLAETDVAPAALRVLGFPASRELPGSAPPECVALPPLPSIATYGAPGLPSAFPAGTDDPEILERLRSLGYVR